MHLPKFTVGLKTDFRHHDDGTNPNQGFFFIGTRITKFLSADYARFEVGLKNHGTERKDVKCSKETKIWSYELLNLHNLLSMRNLLVLAILVTSVPAAKLGCCSVFPNRYSCVVLDARGRILCHSLPVR